MNGSLTPHLPVDIFIVLGSNQKQSNKQLRQLCACAAYESTPTCDSSTRTRIFLKPHFFFYMNRPFRRPHETSESASFRNRPPEWIRAPSTRIGVKKMRFQKCSDSYWHGLSRLFSNQTMHCTALLTSIYFLEDNVIYRFICKTSSDTSDSLVEVESQWHDNKTYRLGSMFYTLDIRKCPSRVSLG